MVDAPFFRDDAKPFAQRSHTMSLDIVRAEDIPAGKMAYVKDESLSLKTDDIHKSRPHYNHLQYLNKPDLCVGSTDPEHAGGQARTYYPSMDRRPRDLSLTTADIDHAQPKASSWKGNRHVDPVNPQYVLPSCIQRATTPPRWNGRHNNDISDIEHAGSKVLHPERNYMRDPNDSRDIEFSSAYERQRGASQRETAMSLRQDRAMDVKDINGGKKKMERDTNPLEPQYKVSTSKVTSLHARYSEERGNVELPPSAPEYHGEVQGSKPKQLHWDNREPQLSLQREDIAGTVPQRWVGSVPQNIYDPPEVRPMISFHEPTDIPGTQVGSLKRGIQTRRVVNPLNPRYSMLDADQKPPAAPTLDGQNPHAMHPMQRTQAQSSSLPNLRRTGGTPPCATPLGSTNGGGMHRDNSCGEGLQSGRMQSGRQQIGYEPSWSAHGGGRTPLSRTPSSSGRLLMQHGPGASQRMEGGLQPGEMSRRSSASGSQRSMGRY